MHTENIETNEEVAFWAMRNFHVLRGYVEHFDYIRDPGGTVPIHEAARWQQQSPFCIGASGKVYPATAFHLDRAHYTEARLKQRSK